MSDWRVCFLFGGFSLVLVVVCKQWSVDALVDRPRVAQIDRDCSQSELLCCSLRNMPRVFGVFIHVQHSSIDTYVRMYVRM